MYKAIITLSLLGAISTGAHAAIVFNGTFEENDLSVYAGFQSVGMVLAAKTQPEGIPDRIRLIDDAHGHGRVAKISLSHLDPLTALGKRSEVVGAVEPLHVERWYAWAYLIPGSWHPSTTVISQFHEAPDLGDFSAHDPTLAFQIQPDGTVVVRNAYDIEAETTPSTYKVRSLTSFKSDRGQWTTVAMRVIWSAGDDGFMEIYKDGQEVFSEHGHPNTFNDALGPYFKAGIYEQDRVGLGLQTLYFAGLVTGDADESLQSVMATVPEPYEHVLWMAGLAILSFAHCRAHISRHRETSRVDNFA